MEVHRELNVRGETIITRHRRHTEPGRALASSADIRPYVELMHPSSV